LATSGIDISKFKRQSTRAAVVSAADRAGVSIKDIMLAAGWSSRNILLTGNEFAKSILQSALIKI
jgi:hypothetical protein